MYSVCVYKYKACTVASPFTISVTTSSPGLTLSQCLPRQSSLLFSFVVVVGKEVFIGGPTLSVAEPARSLALSPPLQFVVESKVNPSRPVLTANSSKLTAALS